MTSLMERFLRFLKKEKTKSVLAFLVYFSIIFWVLEFDMSSVTKVILGIIQFTIVILWYVICLYEITNDSLSPKKKENKIKLIVKEIAMFIPILIITCFITELFVVGTPVNQASIDSDFGSSPIFYSLMIIVFGPIIEEYIFRLLPRKFIKNKYVYIIFSSTMFAAMHVIDDPNAFHYVWFYMMRPIYYGYRYYETDNIWVPISMHSLNNFIAVLPQMILYF